MQSWGLTAGDGGHAVGERGRRGRSCWLPSHLHESVLQRAVKEAALRAGLSKRAGPHTFHRDVSTTMIYTHVLNRGPGGVWSPVDTMLGESPRDDQRGGGRAE